VQRTFMWVLLATILLVFLVTAAIFESWGLAVGVMLSVPRAIGRSLGVVLAVSRPLHLYNRAFSPLVVFFNGSANWTVRRLGIEPREELTSVRSLEELELLIASSRAHGALPEEEAALLARSISFRDKSAADVLVPRTGLVTLDQNATVADLAAASTETGHSRFPVYREDIDDIIGFAHVKDVHRIPPDDRAATPVTEIVQNALVVPETRSVDSLLLEMRREHKPIALVVDEYGAPRGSWRPRTSWRSWSEISKTNTTAPRPRPL
jgi:CBS domain containing-hemolysin-like protein